MGCKICIFLLIVGAFVLMMGCQGEEDDASKEGTGVEIPNPAAEKCLEEGNEYDIKVAEDGSQYGMCTLPDGTECDAWSYYRGECP